MGRCAAILPGRLQHASETSSETYCKTRILATVLTNEGENGTTLNEAKLHFKYNFPWSHS